MIKFLVASTLLTSPIQAKYKEPKQVETFDVTKIHLDVEKINKLSNLLTDLASRDIKETPATNNDVVNAQLLYVALQLNANNKKALDLNKILKTKKSYKSSNFNELRKEFDRLSKLLEQLEADSKNQDALLCAQMIKDPLSSLKPNLTIVKGHIKSRERWHQIIPREKRKNSSLSNARKTYFDLQFYDVSKDIITAKGDSPVTNKNTEWIENNGLSAVKFNKGSLVEFNNENLFKHDEPFTVSAWMYAKQQIQRGSLIGQIDFKNKGKGWYIWFQNGKPILEMNHSYPTNSLKVTGLDTIPTSQWFNLTVTYDGSGKSSGVSIYIDAKKAKNFVSKDTLTKEIKTSQNLTVGGGNTWADLSNVMISSITAHSHALDHRKVFDEVKKYKKISAKVLSTNIIETENTQTKKIGVFELPETITYQNKKLKFKTPLLYEQTTSDFRRSQFLRLSNVAIDISEEKGPSYYLNLDLTPKPLLYLPNNPVRNNVQNLIIKNFGKVPTNKVKITLDINYSPKNKLALSGPIAIGLGASILNQQIAENTIILGTISQEKNYEVGSSFLKYLPILSKQEEHNRVITGKNSNRLLNHILVRKNPSFFVKNEMIECSNYVEALEQATLTKEKDQKVARLFKEVVEVSPNDDIEHKSRTPEIRKKLLEIVELNPNHISAKMILLWSSDERPTYYDTHYANIALSKALAIIETTINDYKISSFNNTLVLNERDIKANRERLEDLLKEEKDFFRGKEEEVFDDLEDSLKDLIKLEKLVNSTSSTKKNQARELFDELNKKYKEMRSNINKNLTSK